MAAHVDLELIPTITTFCPGKGAERGSIRDGCGHCVQCVHRAGKTTLVKMLTTLLPIDEGTATVAGFDVASQPGAVRRVIGLAGQSAAVDEKLTARENLELFARLYKLPRRDRRSRIDGLLARFDMVSFADRPASTYPGGQRRRLDIAAALVADPQALFLDEPTTGLDPRSRAEVWESVRNLAAAGTAIVLTTQYLEEADQLADHIVVIDHGRTVAEGTPVALKADVGRDEGGVAIDDFQLRRPTLDDVFLALTGSPTSSEKEGTLR